MNIEKKYSVYIESSQAGGDSFGVTLWKDDVSATFWGTMQDIHDLGQSIIDEVEEIVEMFNEGDKKIIVDIER